MNHDEQRDWTWAARFDLRAMVREMLGQLAAVQGRSLPELANGALNSKQAAGKAAPVATDQSVRGKGPVTA